MCVLVFTVVFIWQHLQTQLTTDSATASTKLLQSQNKTDKSLSATVMWSQEGDHAAITREVPLLRMVVKREAPTLVTYLQETKEKELVSSDFLQSWALTENNC